MTWLRSRRFYVGMMIGLVPAFLVAAQQSTSTPPAGGDVIVRTYDSCPDDQATERTAALVDMLPPHGVLVETFTGCCNGCSEQ